MRIVFPLLSIIFQVERVRALGGGRYEKLQKVDLTGNFSLELDLVSYSILSYFSTLSNSQLLSATRATLSYPSYLTFSYSCYSNYSQLPVASIAGVARDS